MSFVARICLLIDVCIDAIFAVILLVILAFIC